MREILYRGRDKNGIWHEGYYLCLVGNIYDNPELLNKAGIVLTGGEF